MAIGHRVCGQPVGSMRSGWGPSGGDQDQAVRERKRERERERESESARLLVFSFLG